MQRRTFVQSTLTAAAALSIPRRQAFASIFREPAQFQDVEAVTGDGKPVTLSARAIAELREALRGRVLLAGNEGYDSARQIINPSFDKRPALIAQITGPADIRTAVNFARDHGGLLLAVKCGGHSFAGYSTCDRGMMIDLSPFRGVRVDPAARKAWVAGGTLLGQVDHEALAHGLVVPLGTVSHTGVGGLVTGGGFGRVGRRFGLAIDNLTAVDVIAADGRFYRASAEENRDLYWGVRGGGGNFGIVTSFQFELHPMQRRVVGGSIIFPMAKARDALMTFADLLRSSPDDLYVSFRMGPPPGGGPPAVILEVCYTGAENNAERVLAPIRKLSAPLRDEIKAVDYVALQRSGDLNDARAIAGYVKSGFTADLPDRLISSILEGFPGNARPGLGVYIPAGGGGAIARVPAPATAYAQRDAFANIIVGTGWPVGADPTPNIERVRTFWKIIEPFTTGFYINDGGEHTGAAIKSNYRGNHDRLVAVKNKFDPKNLFRLNANIVPTVG